MRKAQIGSISTGTLRDEDLLNAFASELRAISDAPAHIKLCDDAEAMLARLENEDDEDAREEVSDVVGELQDALSECAPDFCYFGSHEGDGSDFGFWPSMDAIEEAIHDEAAVRVEGTPDYLVQVNDHGNMTLYRVKLEEVWSIV